MACDKDCDHKLVAVKRPQCPELLFAMFKWVIVYQPFRWLFTVPVGGSHG